MWQGGSSGGSVVGSGGSIFVDFLFVLAAFIVIVFFAGIVEMSTTISADFDVSAGERRPVAWVIGKISDIIPVVMVVVSTKISSDIDDFVGEKRSVVWVVTADKTKGAGARMVTFIRMGLFQNLARSFFRCFECNRFHSPKL